MYNFKKLFALISAMLVFVACSSQKKPYSMNEEAQERSHHHHGHEMTNEEMDSLSKAQGNQEDLVAYVGDRIFFPFDSVLLTSEAEMILERQARWMMANPHVMVNMEGHCDERGTREYNLALGDRRATAAKNYVVSLGVEANRVHVISYGKERPEVMGNNEEAWSKNRRSVVVIR